MIIAIAASENNLNAMLTLILEGVNGIAFIIQKPTRVYLRKIFHVIIRKVQGAGLLNFCRGKM